MMLNSLISGNKLVQKTDITDVMEHWWNQKRS